MISGTILARARALLVWLAMSALGLLHHLAGPAAAQPVSNVRPDELAAGIHRRIVAVPRPIFPVDNDGWQVLEDVAATISWAYGPAAVPNLDRAVGLEGEDGVALMAIAMMSDDAQAFAVMQRRAAEPFPSNGILYVTYMPPVRRDELAWEVFHANASREPRLPRMALGGGGEERVDDGGIGSWMCWDAAHVLMEAGTMEHASAVVARLSSNPDAGVYAEFIASLRRRIEDRARLDKMLGGPSADLTEWRAVQLRHWLRKRRAHVVIGTGSAKGLPTPFCVARAQFVPSDSDLRSDTDYSRFCGQGAFWQALHDVEGVAEIATDPKRPEDLRRAAIRLLAAAPHLLDGIENPSLSDSNEVQKVTEALETLEAFAVIGDANVRTWMVEEILAQKPARDQYRPIMQTLSIDKRLPDDLRRRCQQYGQP